MSLKQDKKNHSEKVTNVAYKYMEQLHTSKNFNPVIPS